MENQRKYPPFETRERIMKWCAMQERAHFDADVKLRSWGVPEDEREQIIVELISDNFLNEERYARAFARGKFRMKKWGWNKIKMELKRKGVSKYSTALAKEEIEADEYAEALREVIRKKWPLINAKNDWERTQKLLQYAANRGYEYEIVQKCLEEYKAGNSD